MNIRVDDGEVNEIEVGVCSPVQNAQFVGDGSVQPATEFDFEKKFLTSSCVQLIISTDGVVLKHEI
jgi:hypothetical protein